jgi:kynurenine formamidase
MPQNLNRGFLKHGAMPKRIIDLTLALPKEVVVPVTKVKPAFYSEIVTSFEKEGYESHKISMYLHAGTHIDAPLHFIKGGKSIDQAPLDLFIGDALVFDLTFKKPAEGITAADLEKASKDLAKEGISLSNIKRVLLRTDCIRLWPDASYWEKSPYLTEEAAKWLVNKGFQLVGYDSFQEVKDYKERGFPIHKIILGAGLFQIEYVCNLDKLERNKIYLIAMPMSVKGVEASPARVVAIEE